MKGWAIFELYRQRAEALAAQNAASEADEDEDP